MCYLCLQDNPFAIPEDHSQLSLQKKKARAALVKELLKDLESYKPCEDGIKEVEALKEEQYRLSREL
jgi:hypothetical protein